MINSRQVSVVTLTTVTNWNIIVKIRPSLPASLPQPPTPDTGEWMGIEPLIPAEGAASRPIGYRLLPVDCCRHHRWRCCRSFSPLHQRLGTVAAAAAAAAVPPLVLGSSFAGDAERCCCCCCCCCRWRWGRPVAGSSVNRLSCDIFHRCASIGFSIYLLALRFLSFYFTFGIKFGAVVMATPLKRCCMLSISIFFSFLYFSFFYFSFGNVPLM